MYPLLETICLDAGTFRNLPSHEDRVMRSCWKLFGTQPQFGLHHALTGMPMPQSGLHKCRVRYDAVNFEVEIEPYHLRPIRSLRLVDAPELVYDLKYANRAELNTLFARRGDCDDVLITQHGWIKDTSYGNICFLQGGCWYTPEQPLLHGTMREWMLKQEWVRPRAIHIRDLSQFSHFVVINAFRNQLFQEGPVQAIIVQA